MAQFVYEGPGHGLSIAGRDLTRGIPVSLEGRAAEAASNHPDVRAIDTPGQKSTTTKKKAPTGLAEFAALRARATDLGIPATGKKADLTKAIAAEEKRLADEAAAAEADAAAGSGDGAG